MRLAVNVKRSEKTLLEGLEQTATYMDINNATEGHLIIFDPAPGLSWDEKIYTAEHSVGTKKITVWGL